VQRELTGLCARENKIFIDVHACSSSISTALDDFTASLDDLFEAIPELEDECLSFAKSTRGIQIDRERASVILERQDPLLDILEVPQLVDTCVRNGYYQEAMELATHINQVARRYPDLAIVRSVARSMESVMDMQLSQLLGLLRESIKLPAMAKTIGFLRRMDRLSEEELRMVFLESRVDHMRSAVEGLHNEKNDKIRYLRRYIDLFREVVYETVSQYNSIFMNLGTAASDRHQEEGALDLVARYVQHNVQQLTVVIHETLDGIQDSSSLSSLLTQLGYSTMSFARMGSDFTALLRNPFETAVESLVATGWVLATDQLTDKFDEATRLELRPGSWLASEEGKAVILADISSPPDRPALQSSTIPPAYLAFFPPLAIYLNHGLGILNSLRLLAPTKSRYKATQALVRSLAQSTTRFLDYARAVTEERLKPSYKRPDSMRRNTSISNQGQLLEQDKARILESRRVLVAAADAMLGVMFPFLLSAMQNVVYSPSHERDADGASLGESQAALERWLSDNREPSESAHTIAIGGQSGTISPTGDAPGPDHSERMTVSSSGASDSVANQKGFVKTSDMSPAKPSTPDSTRSEDGNAANEADIPSEVHLTPTTGSVLGQDRGQTANPEASPSGDVSVPAQT
jgi:hypothetical protein